MKISKVTFYDNLDNRIFKYCSPLVKGWLLFRYLLPCSLKLRMQGLVDHNVFIRHTIDCDST